jgi:hypothetical protein
MLLLMLLLLLLLLLMLLLLLLLLCLVDLIAVTKTIGSARSEATSKILASDQELKLVKRLKILQWVNLKRENMSLGLLF